MLSSTAPWIARLLCLFATQLTACSAVLDFDDECELEADCLAFGRGLDCDEGFCVPKDLIESGGPCDRLLGEDPRAAEPGTVITLGALLPRGDALGAFGGMENGVILAVQEINRSGGVLGRQLGVVSCDDATDPDKAVLAARHLVDVAHVAAIIGAGESGVTIEAFNKVAKEARVLMMSPSATSPAISDLPDDGLLWRTAPSDGMQGRAIAEYVLARSYAKVGIVNRNDADGNALAAAIKATLCDSERFVCSGETLVSRTYTVQTGALQADEQARALGDLATFAPDAIVLIGLVQDGIDFLNLASGSGLRFILSGGMRDVALFGAVAGQVGVSDPAMRCTLVGTFPAGPSGELFEAFTFEYEELFKVPPGTFAAYSYDATYLLALAYAAAEGAGIREPDGRALADGLARMSSGLVIPLGDSELAAAVTELQAGRTIDVSGVSGPLDFDAALGEAPSGVEMWRLDPGRQMISNLGVVYDGEHAYDFAAVLQAQPALTCEGVR